VGRKGSNVQRNIFKSIAAVFAGAIVGIVLSVGTDAAMRWAGIFPQDDRPMSDALFALATLYRTIYGVLGGYVTARLAPHRPMMHALVLGATGMVASIAGAIATWSKLPAMGPKWYPLLLIALALPPAWLGGKLRQLQLNSQF
jgi:hypothetical protein